MFVTLFTGMMGIAMLTSWLLFVMFIVILLLSHLITWDRYGTVYNQDRPVLTFVNSYFAYICKPPILEQIIIVGYYMYVSHCPTIY